MPLELEPKKVEFYFRGPVWPPPISIVCQVKYEATKEGGFQIVGGVEPEPVTTVGGRPVDTVAVQRAKAEHALLFDQIATRNSHPPAPLAGKLTNGHLTPPYFSRVPNSIQLKGVVPFIEPTFNCKHLSEVTVTCAMTVILLQRPFVLIEWKFFNIQRFFLINFM